MDQAKKQTTQVEEQSPIIWSQALVRPLRQQLLQWSDAQYCLQTAHDSTMKALIRTNAFETQERNHPIPCRIGAQALFDMSENSENSHYHHTIPSAPESHCPNGLYDTTRLQIDTV